MKKKVTVIVVVLVCLILLFPIRLNLDGGDVQYKSLTYSITKVSTLISDEEAKQEGKVKPYDEGFVVEILGIKVLDNVK